MWRAVVNVDANSDVEADCETQNFFEHLLRISFLYSGVATTLFRYQNDNDRSVFSHWDFTRKLIEVFEFELNCAKIRFWLIFRQIASNSNYDMRFDRKIKLKYLQCANCAKNVTQTKQNHDFYTQTITIYKLQLRMKLA